MKNNFLTCLSISLFFSCVITPINSTQNCFFFSQAIRSRLLHQHKKKNICKQNNEVSVATP